MTRTVLIADGRPATASLTRLLGEIEFIELVAHAGGRAPVNAVVRRARPDLVVVDDMRWPPQALARIAEVRAAAPAAAVVVVAGLEGSWLAQALRLGAAAVMPASADPETYRRILAEVVTRTPVAA